MPKHEIVVLSNVHCEGLYLRVSDGRMLMVNADDAASVSKWKANTNLTIRHIGDSGMFNLELQRGDAEPPIRAAWL